jgi:hypothetical protein
MMQLLTVGGLSHRSAPSLQRSSVHESPSLHERATPAQPPAASHTSLSVQYRLSVHDAPARTVQLDVLTAGSQPWQASPGFTAPSA